MQFPTIPVVSRRMAAVPSEGVEWTFDFYGKRTIDEEGTAAAQKNFDAAINYRLRQHGGRAFLRTALEGLDRFDAFHDWAMRALREIMAEHLGQSKAKHETVGHWRFRGGIVGWRSQLRADFVLVSLFIDGHNTLGRSLAVLSGGGLHSRCGPHARRPS